jgi:excisionase family DNA binding protein
MAGVDPDVVLTIDELSVYLKVPKSTLYKLVREGKIPCQKVGRHWRFHKSAIEVWLHQHPEPGTTQEARTVVNATGRERDPKHGPDRAR